MHPFEPHYAATGNWQRSNGDYFYTMTMLSRFGPNIASKAPLGERIPVLDLTEEFIKQRSKNSVSSNSRTKSKVDPMESNLSVHPPRLWIFLGY